jgi:hypothetical protein
MNSISASQHAAPFGHRLSARRLAGGSSAGQQETQPDKLKC